MNESSRKFLPVCLLALLAAPGCVEAQSSATLYGAIDTSLTYVNHADAGRNLWSQGNASNGELSGTGWGISGNEVLGRGLSAIFRLENGFDPGSGRRGQGGRMFGRAAYVGMAGTRAGTLTFGRQYDPLSDAVGAITADADFGSSFATPGDVDNGDFSFWVDRSIKLVLPDMAGFRFSAMYALGGVAGASGAARSYAAAVSYHRGGLRMAGGYLYTANNRAHAMRTGWAGTADGPFDGPINAGYETAGAIGIARIAGQYTTRRMTAGASFSNAQYRHDGASTFSATERYDTVQGFLTYRPTRAARIGIGYAYTAARGDASAHYHQVSLGAVYSLSPRVDIYATATWQRASGATNDGSGGVMPAQASIGSYGYAGTRTQAIGVAGIRYQF